MDPDQVPVEMRQQFVAVEAADHRQDGAHRLVGERIVEVGYPRGHRRRVAFVAFVDVRAVGQGEPHRGEAPFDDGGMIVFADHGAGAGGGDDTYLVTGPQLGRINDVHAGQTNRSGWPAQPDIVGACCRAW